MVERARPAAQVPGFKKPDSNKLQTSDLFDYAKETARRFLQTLLGPPRGNPGDMEESKHTEKFEAAQTLQRIGRGAIERKSLRNMPRDNSGRTSPVSQPDTEAAELEFVTENSSRSFQIDRMLNELSTHNRTKALEEVGKLTANSSESAYLFQLLLEHEARTGSKPDLELHQKARTWLIRYVSTNSSFIQNGKLTLNPNAYSIYQHLKQEPISTSQESLALQKSINFIRPGVTTEGAIAALGQAAQDYTRIPTLPRPAPRYSDGAKALSSHIKIPVNQPKSDQDFHSLTFGTAYLATTQSLNIKDQTNAKFIESTRKIAENLQQKQPLTNAEQRFLSVQRVLDYRLMLGDKIVSNRDKPVFLGTIGLETTNADIEKRLQNIKDQYFTTNYPFSAQNLQVTKGEEIGKIDLSNTQPFEAQMRALNLDWKLSDIIKLATTEGLPKSFLNRFADHGASLYRDHIYPTIIASQPSAASAEEIEKLLPPGASNERRAKFWRDTLRFMKEDLKGSAIRADQVENMLGKLMKVGDKQVYIIQAAGTGKSTMARYCARVLLRDASFILFASPFNEPRAGVEKLMSIDQLIHAHPENGKPPEFYITAEEYAAILESAPPEQIRALKFGLHILDEFDSEDYGNARELLVKAGVSRVANMSASDDDLKLLNKLQRKQFKLDSGPEPGEKTEQWRARKLQLEKDIREIQKNIELEFSRPIAVTGENFDPKSIPPGKVSLILHPDIQDADTLAKEYQNKLPPGGIVLYRDNFGQRMALTSKGSKYNYEAFLGVYDKLTPKPSIFCLYTKDSRGGDFEQFSCQDAGQDHIIEQHIFLRNPISRNELYQYLRRLRGNNRNVNVFIHLEPNSPITNWEALRQRSEEIQKIKSQRDESVRLTDKIQRKMREFVKSALNTKWTEINQLELQPFWTKETYDQAVSEVLSNWSLKKSDPIEEYQRIHTAVIDNFLQRVNESVQSFATQDLELQASILSGLNANTLWSSRNSLTQQPKEGIPLKTLWNAYLESKGLTQHQIDSLAKRIFGPNTNSLDAKFQSSMLAGTIIPTLVTNTFVATKFQEIARELQKEIAQTKSRSNAIERLKQIAPNPLKAEEMSSETQRALNNVKFYQKQLRDLNRV